MRGDAESWLGQARSGQAQFKKKKTQGTCTVPSGTRRWRRLTTPWRRLGCGPCASRPRRRDTKRHGTIPPHQSEQTCECKGVKI